MNRKKILIPSLLLITTVGIGAIFYFARDETDSISNQPSNQVNGANEDSIALVMEKFDRNNFNVEAKFTSTSSVETIQYETTYENQEYTKEADIYLPPGYTENKDTRYNILYLMHGYSMDFHDFLTNRTTNDTSELRNMLDTMINQGLMKPVIVVTATYYPTKDFIRSSWNEDDPLNLAFAKNELPNDLIPAVERNYRTFASENAQSEFETTREHRAFAGFSMGAITTWYVFQHNLDLFAHFLPMAGDSWTVRANGGSTAPDETARVLADSVQEAGYYAKDFQILATVGSADSTRDQMSGLVDALRNYPDYFTISNLQFGLDENGGHTNESLMDQLYSTLPLIFN